MTEDRQRRVAECQVSECTGREGGRRTRTLSGDAGWMDDAHS